MATQDLDTLARRRAELRDTFLLPDDERPASNGRGVHHLALICRDPETTMQSLKKTLQDSWRQLRETPIDQLLESRFDKLIGHGKFKEVEQK